MKKTLIIGASTNEDRYAYKAAIMLLRFGHEICMIGKSKGNIAGHVITTEKVIFHDIDTVTLYINPKNQIEYYNYILEINPKRVIFNPGTENVELERMLNLKNIQTLQACTLVLLSTSQY